MKERIRDVHPYSVALCLEFLRVALRLYEIRARELNYFIHPVEHHMTLMQVAVLRLTQAVMRLIGGIDHPAWFFISTLNVLLIPILLRCP